MNWRGRWWMRKTEFQPCAGMRGENFTLFNNDFYEKPAYLGTDA
jgi:hypothetical protein